MVLETKRLILREMALYDVDDLFQVLSDPEAMQFYQAAQACRDFGHWQVCLQMSL